MEYKVNEKALPELIIIGKEGYNGIKPRGLISLLIKAVQEQQVMIEELQNSSVTKRFGKKLNKPKKVKPKRIGFMRRFLNLFKRNKQRRLK